MRLLFLLLLIFTIWVLAGCTPAKNDFDGGYVGAEMLLECYNDYLAKIPRKDCPQFEK